MGPILAIVQVLLLFALLVAAIILYLRSRKVQGGAEVSASLQTLTQAVQSGQTQTAVMSEKLSHLEPVPQSVNAVQVELTRLAERVSTVEQNQQTVGQGIQAVETGLAQTSTVAGALVEATTAIRSELARARDGLTDLQAHAKARQEVEQRTSEFIRRLEAIIAGTHTKGAAGENILEIVFAKLPADWQVRDFRVGNKVVEFGLRLPNNLILPIDSKWPATNLLEQFADCEDPGEQQRLKGQIESTVLGKAKEVRKYIDPSQTVTFGVVAVPDAVYDLCCGIQAAVCQENVALIAYSMFVPYLLLVFQTVLKTSQNLDLEKLGGYLQAAQSSVDTLREELEGRFSRAITMLSNARDNMSLHLGKVSSGLTCLRIGADTGSKALPSPEANTTKSEGVSQPQQGQSTRMRAVQGHELPSRG
jgi:DNA recombination protein RmuC